MQLKRLITDPRYRFVALAEKGFLNWMPDAFYLKMKYKLVLNKPLNLKNPKTFNEKLQWLKIHNRNPLYTQLVDKYEVKKYVGTLIGHEHIIPTYGVWNSFEEITWEDLPDSFVLKTTHDSGGIAICSTQATFNKTEAKIKLSKALKRNFYWHGREWPYKNVKPRIIAEQYMVDESGCDLTDYKFFCFNGIPRLIQVNYDKLASYKKKYYTTDWDSVDIKREFNCQTGTEEIRRPTTLEEMLIFSKELSHISPFVRVDFYETNGTLFFGELTLYPTAGFGKFTPEEWDVTLGSWINLSAINPNFKAEDFTIMPE